jgi:Sigma-54 interaction domain
MILTAERPVPTNQYRVEVSGWDDSKAFFVENSELEWTDESGKHVTLNRELTEGAVVFLRLLQTISNDRAHPVAYKAELVASTDESQLFGHMHGSFTGATDTRPGLFEFANNGTVFLDEVGETSLAMQAKLLRVIQNREIQRVGSPEVRQINVRLIAATNRDLRARSWRSFPRGLVLPAEFHPDSHPSADRAAGGHSAAGAILSQEVQRSVGKDNFRADSARASGVAAACLARERPRTGECDLQRLHHL